MGAKPFPKNLLPLRREAKRKMTVASLERVSTNLEALVKFHVNLCTAA